VAGGPAAPLLCVDEGTLSAVSTQFLRMGCSLFSCLVLLRPPKPIGRERRRAAHRTHGVCILYPVVLAILGRLARVSKNVFHQIVPPVDYLNGLVNFSAC